MCLRCIITTRETVINICALNHVKLYYVTVSLGLMLSFDIDINHLYFQYPLSGSVKMHYTRRGD